MNNINVKEYYRWFNSYVKDFYGEDDLINQNIELKEKHTLNVAKHSVDIAKSLELSSEEIDIAEIIGLFHDVGRFEQFKIYKTFRDSVSVNHAELGIKVLEENKVLKELSTNNQEIIIKAIYCHNIKELSSISNKKEDLFCRLIRDADKLDIFRIIIQYEKERSNNPNPAIDNLPFTSGYNKELVESLLKNERISNNLLKNYNDRKLYELSWIVDVNFPYSFKQIKDNGVLQTLISCLPQNDDINKVINHFNIYIDEHIKK